MEIIIQSSFKDGPWTDNYNAETYEEAIVSLDKLRKYEIRYSGFCKYRMLYRNVIVKEYVIDV